MDLALPKALLTRLRMLRVDALALKKATEAGMKQDVVTARLGDFADELASLAEETRAGITNTEE